MAPQLAEAALANKVNRQWLHRNHQASQGIWLVFGKSGKVKTLTAAEALEEALCFGWIDGQVQSLDDQKYRKRFTPRRGPG